MITVAEPILKQFTKLEVPKIEVGDVVRVHQKIREGNKERIQVFEGIVIAISHGQGVTATFTVRKIASGIGVEKVFPLHSPSITKVEFKHGSKVQRAKLYYLRSLTGKALKMKDRDTKKEAWAEVLGEDVNVPTEASEEDIAEAVKAEAERQAAEAQAQVITEAGNEPSGEVNDEAQHQNSGEEPGDNQPDTGAGNDPEGNRD